MRATASWLQKHPSPSSAGWEFHWYSANESEASEVVASLTEGRHQHPLSGLLLRGEELWWIRSFEGKAPSEQRRYTGLLVEKIAGGPGCSPEQLLACATMTPAQPWTASAGSIEPRDVVPAAVASVPQQTRRASARLVAAGGRLKADSIDELLPLGVAGLLPWLPELEHCLRSGLLAAAYGPALPPGARTLAHYLELIAFGKAPHQQRDRAWQLAGDFAKATETGREQAFSELAELAAAWTDDASLWRYLRAHHITDTDLARCAELAPAPLWHDGIADAGRLWNRILNYWGRGFLADSAAHWISIVLLGRIAVDHLYRLEHEAAAHPWRYLARLRWEALLPAARAQAMLTRLARCSPTLGRVVAG